MGAFLDRDRQLIEPAERQRIGDSLDLDEACRPAFPNANRWDYVFSVSDARKLVALEPHHANDSEISAVIAKKQHASTYLTTHLRPGQHVAEWLWVSHGRTSFSKMESARRRLDQAGIKYVGRRVNTLG